MTDLPMPTRMPWPMAAIIDLDGTLVDTVGDFELALHAALADLGLPEVGRSFILRTIGKGSEHLVRSTLQQLQAPASLFDQALQRYQHHYLRINGLAATVYPGAREGLQRLAERGVPLACVTNKPGAFAGPLLQALGLAPFFQSVFGGDAFARKKPDPLPLLETCKALGSLPAATWMVGDSVNDVLAARAAGCPVALVSYGYNHGEPASAAGADVVVDRLDQLPLPERPEAP